MTLYGLATFCAVYVLAVATPGPGIAAIIARTLAQGLRGAPAFIAGVLLGDLTWFSIAATGLAALAKTAALLFVGIKWAGVAYLLYLAWKLWTTPAERLDVRADAPANQGRQAFLGGLALTLANPKAILFFLALLPTVIHLDTLNVASFLAITACMCVLLPAVFAVYALLAARARDMFTTQKAVRRLNRGSGVAMAGAAIAIATR